MNGNMLRTVTALAMAVGITTAGIVTASAEEGLVKAVATWKGHSFAFPVGQDQAYLVGVYSGTLYVDDGKGPLHAASIVCPATAEGDLKNMTKTGQGRCILTDEEGNRVYARFTCTGDLEGCRYRRRLLNGNKTSKDSTELTASALRGKATKSGRTPMESDSRIRLDFVGQPA